MEAQKKRAYRWLLYKAMLDIRPIRWIGGRWRQRLNRLCWWSQSQQVRVAGAIADWLHNLAHYSAEDFVRFDEEHFWRDNEWFLANYTDERLKWYRVEF
jgi:hypothetical protein